MDEAEDLRVPTGPREGEWRAVVDEVVGDALGQAGEVAGVDGVEDAARGVDRGIADGILLIGWIGIPVE